MSKFYISEKDTELTQEETIALTGYMNEEGFDTEYGNSENNMIDSNEDYYAFLHVFNTVLGRI